MLGTFDVTDAQASRRQNSRSELLRRHWLSLVEMREIHKHEKVSIGQQFCNDLLKCCTHATNCTWIVHRSMIFHSNSALLQLCSSRPPLVTLFLSVACGHVFILFADFPWSMILSLPLLAWSSLTGRENCSGLNSEPRTMQECFQD